METFKKYYHLINEGGAAGHMAHPFDLEGVTTGKKLLKLFDRAVQHINKKSAAVKLDGVNISVKLIDSDQHPIGKEFAVDRGSMKMIDLEGITFDRLEERFPPIINTNAAGEITNKEHGLIKAGQILLSILNEALPEIERELKSLKMWNNSDFFLNTEFIEKGGTNVIKYGKNMIAFHGINQFKLKSTGKSRYSEEYTKYNRDIFNTLVNKVHQVSSRVDSDGNKIYDFDTHGVIDVSFVRQPDFADVLDSKVEIILTPEHHETRTLGLWLAGAKNPGKAKVKTTDVNMAVGVTESMSGTIEAMQKKVYQYVIGEDSVSLGPLSDKFTDENDAKLAIDAAIFWHATKLLGIEINTNLETFDNEKIPIGEGIVVRDLPSGKTRSVGNKRVSIPYPPFKITGEFIISGLMSAF